MPNNDVKWESCVTSIISSDNLLRQKQKVLPKAIPSLVVLSGESQGQRYLLNEEMILIGRSSKANIRIATDNVSRLHARILRNSSGDYLIEDMGSCNGTHVNGLPIKKQVLNIGDKIEIGSGSILLYTHHFPLEEKFLEGQKLESIGRLAGGIAHDFKNIMASLLTDVRYLQGVVQKKGGFDHNEVANCLANMERAATRSVELTDQLLGFAQQGKYESRPFDFAELVQEVVAFLRSTLGNKIEIETELKDKLFIRGDRTQLHQVLINLCLNACDAMSDGGTLSFRGVITSFCKEDHEGFAYLTPTPHVVLTIKDTGIGMDEETRQRAFEPYFTTKGVGKGSGLGLAAVYGIVKNHGGQVQLDSQLGQGTTVCVYLPASRVEPTSEFSKQITTSSLPVLGGTVVVADRDPVVRAQLEQWLTELGFKVQLAGTESETFRQLNTYSTEALFVILDPFLPYLGSKDSLNKIWQIKAELKVIFTAKADDRPKLSHLMPLGVKGLLEKPLSLSAVRTAIEHWIWELPVR